MRRDLSAYKGMTLKLRGVVDQNHRPRPFTTKLDTLEFGLAVAPNNSPIITKDSNAGIEIADDGTYEVTVTADEMSRTSLPLPEYWYALRIIEGDTSEKHLLVMGKLTLSDLPFGT